MGPVILKWLPPNIAANMPAQTAVIVPASGVAFDATAKEIEIGIEASPTVMPGRRLSLIFLRVNERMGIVFFFRHEKILLFTVYHVVLRKAYLTGKYLKKLVTACNRRF